MIDSKIILKNGKIATNSGTKKCKYLSMYKLKNSEIRIKN